jgi:hypothetical protein
MEVTTENDSRPTWQVLVIVALLFLALAFGASVLMAARMFTPQDWAEMGILNAQQAEQVEHLQVMNDLEESRTLEANQEKATRAGYWTTAVKWLAYATGIAGAMLMLAFSGYHTTRYAVQAIQTIRVVNLRPIITMKSGHQLTPPEYNDYNRLDARTGMSAPVQQLVNGDPTRAALEKMTVIAKSLERMESPQAVEWLGAAITQEKQS